ncbi:PEGA domain-containing protein [Sorangium sp. So ce131]|uniref:PEGA domain-containing protein n=1 Tax=Sorangium sp. So ce131 TaxID=3133282 RepID=UPI003F636D70
MKPIPHTAALLASLLLAGLPLPSAYAQPAPVAPHGGAPPPPPDVIAEAGELEIRGGEPGALVTIDGRGRGELPSPPLRVAPGVRAVRIYKRGFALFEELVDVEGGRLATLEARMTELQQAGTLKIVEPRGRRADVVIDSAIVGATPWEGPLAPGSHTVILRGDGNTGTEPVAALVRENEVTSLTLAVEELGAELRVEPTPPGAMVAVDGVILGRGAWSGGLRPGAHEIEVGLDGWVRRRARTSLAHGEARTLPVALSRDPDAARGGRRETQTQLELRAGPAVTPSFGGGVAGACSGACDAGLGVGLQAGLRLTYQLPSALVYGVELGALHLGQRVAGRPTSATPRDLPPNPGLADDDLALTAVLFGASTGLRLGEQRPISLNLGLGGLVGSVSAARRGTFRTVPRPDHDSADPYEVDVSQGHLALSLYAAPEVRAGLMLGERLEVSVGVQAMLLFMITQATWDPGRSTVTAAGDGAATFPADRLTGRTLLTFTPSLALRYRL